MSNSTIITMPKPAELERSAMTMSDRARSVQIASQEDYDKAAELLLGIKDLRNEAELHHRPIISAAHQAHKAALTGLGKIDSPLAEAEGIIKPKMSAYLADQERIRLEAERIQREEQERALAEQIESEIEQAEANGATAEEVSAIISQPMPMPAISAPVAVRQVAGVSAAKTYRAEVYSIRELCKAVAEGKAPEAYVTANMPNLNGMARSTRGSLKVPGVRIVEETGIRAGRR